MAASSLPHGECSACPGTFQRHIRGHAAAVHRSAISPGFGTGCQKASGSARCDSFWDARPRDDVQKEWPILYNGGPDSQIRWVKMWFSFGSFSPCYFQKRSIFNHPDPGPHLRCSGGHFPSPAVHLRNFDCPLWNCFPNFIRGTPPPIGSPPVLPYGIPIATYFCLLSYFS
jgi:hypothetical protein